MRVLLVDNFDSYTYNLYQLLANATPAGSEGGGVQVRVVRNDAWHVDDCLANGPWDAIVLSPGPGTPERAEDLGLCAPILSDPRLQTTPILGVCLGHQAIGLTHGACVSRAPRPFHGRLSSVRHGGHPIFAGVPSSSDAAPDAFRVVRYHSLVVPEASLPACLEAIAWTHPDPADGDADGPLVMALAHRDLPRLGLQFHPESVW